MEDIATHQPLVSVCLPNLNNRRFLEERIATIFAQTLEDWELVICDSYSDDGAWEYFQGIRKDPRVRLFQVPREGIYAGWNECVRRARGKFVYIATSDDTMTEDCLSQMVEALEGRPECGLCHCALGIIDEVGESHRSAKPWTDYDGVCYFGDLMRRKHLRSVPHDGLLGIMLEGVYLSITQLLIRRSLFEQTGLFEAKWGPFGDYAWYLRAGFLTNTLHLPEQLATWRLHPGQASQYDHYLRAHAEGTMLRIADEALEHAAAINPRLQVVKDSEQVRWPLRAAAILARIHSVHGRTRRLRAGVAAIFEDPMAVIHAWRIADGRSTRISFAKKQLERLGVTGPSVV